MAENRKLVLRFAPSPTGMPHIGGARTTLFNWTLSGHSDAMPILLPNEDGREQ